MKALDNFNHGRNNYKRGDDFIANNPIEEKQLIEAGLIGELKTTPKSKKDGKPKSKKKL